ncbi:hypothetical protein GCM10008179_04800 [Hansschlegelia plantiphila]|uniref:Uncharacterized protein n=1 Tax=Hansschlegelia plantiphila TaxID=374655 RepID=A0A9W6IXH7_9HYPH|nr:hypothetical protein GCM10008179_04800 [Hansschlegelia plantiphila]
MDGANGSRDFAAAQSAVLRDAVLWTAPRHEGGGVSVELPVPHAEERRLAAGLEARASLDRGAAFFWINLAQRRARVS